MDFAEELWSSCPWSREISPWIEALVPWVDRTMIPGLAIPFDELAPWQWDAVLILRSEINRRMTPKGKEPDA